MYFYLLTNCKFSPRKLHTLFNGPIFCRLIFIISHAFELDCFQFVLKCVFFFHSDYFTTWQLLRIKWYLYYWYTCEHVVPIVSGVLIQFIYFYFFIAVSCRWSSIVINCVQFARIEFYEEHEKFCILNFVNIPRGK